MSKGKCRICGNKTGDRRTTRCLACFKKSIKGKNNYNWKGNKVTYSGLHAWIRNNKPKPLYCEECKKLNDKLEIANISGEYRREISDFRWLCRSCHSKEHRSGNEWYNCMIKFQKLKGDKK